jgi:hypothetical protein
MIFYLIDEFRLFLCDGDEVTRVRRKLFSFNVTLGITEGLNKKSSLTKRWTI